MYPLVSLLFIYEQYTNLEMEFHDLVFWNTQNRSQLALYLAIVDLRYGLGPLTTIRA